MDKRSFAAADEMPWKLVQHPRAVNFDTKDIVPIHLQLSPTNRCCCKCDWCSCSEVDRKQEIPIAELEEIIETFADYGTEAVTITGGGEPLMHPDFLKLIDTCDACYLDIGLVTNGWLFKKLDKYALEILNDSVTWCRLSVTDTVGDYPVGMLEDIIISCPNIDFGISFVTIPGYNIETVSRICDLANENKNVTHIRFVCDILNPSPVTMARLMRQTVPLTQKGLYQSRSDPLKGVSDCRIGKLKPFIYSDGYVYPCCGVQYAIKGKERGLPPEMRMCHWREYLDAKMFDGRVCDRCYYTDYNKTLRGMVRKLKHANFL